MASIEQEREVTIPLCCYLVSVPENKAIRTIQLVDLIMIGIELVAILIVTWSIAGYRAKGINFILVISLIIASIILIAFMAASVINCNSNETLRARTKLYRNSRFFIILFKVLVLIYYLVTCGVALSEQLTGGQKLMNGFAFFLLAASILTYGYALFLNQVLGNAVNLSEKQGLLGTRHVPERENNLYSPTQDFGSQRGIIGREFNTHNL